MRYNYELLSWQVSRVAGGLAALEIQMGDRVAIWAANMPAWVISMLAIAKLGAVFVPVDPGAGEEDLKYILEQAECVALMVSGDPATGEDLPPDTPGELCTRGFLMKEYYGMPGATAAAAVDRDGWFHTGDLGEMDAKGYFRIIGRLKDVIVRDTMEIFPVEVEECLYRHPDVSEVQVFGVPHAGKGQEVAAWVKTKPGSKLNVADLAVYAEENVAEKMRPRYFKIVDDFPMTRSGKVQKFMLTELAAREIGIDPS